MENSSLIEYRPNGPTISDNPLDPRLNPNFKYKESSSILKILKWTNHAENQASKSFQGIKDTENKRCSSNKQKLTSPNSCSVLNDCSKIVISDSETQHAVRTNPNLNTNRKTNQIFKPEICQCIDTAQTLTPLEKLNSEYEKLHAAEGAKSSKTIRNLNSSSCKFRCNEEIEILNRYKSLKESYSSPQSQYSIIERFNNGETTNCKELHQNKNLQTNCSSSNMPKRFENNYESRVDFRCTSNNNETYNISSVDKTENYTEIDLHLQVKPTNRKEKEQFSPQRSIPKTLNENHKQSNIITDKEIVFQKEILSEKRLVSQNFCDKNNFKSAEKENEQDSNAGKSSKLYEHSKNGTKSSNSSMTENCLSLESNLADHHLTVERQNQDSTKVNSCLHTKGSNCTLDGLNKNPDITNSDNGDEELCMRQFISKDLGGENHKCSAKKDVYGKHTEIDLHLQVTPTNIKEKKQYRPQHSIPKTLDENHKPSDIITDNEFMFLQEILSEKRLVSQNFCDENNFKLVEKENKEESNTSKLDEHSRIDKLKSSDNSMTENYLKLESYLVDQHCTVEHKDLDSTKTNSCLYSTNVKRFNCNPDDLSKTPNITHSDNIDELHQSQLISKDICGENHKLIRTLNNQTKKKLGLVKADQNFGNEGNLKSTVVRYQKVPNFNKSQSKQNFPTQTFKCVKKRKRKTFNIRKPVIYQNSKNTWTYKKYTKGGKCTTLKSNITGKLLKAKKYNANRLSHFHNIKINSHNNVAKEMIIMGKENKSNETKKYQIKSDNELFSQAQLNSRTLQEENPESEKAVTILTDINLRNEFKWKSAAERKYYVFSEINTQSDDGNENSNDETRQSDTPESERDSLILKCDSINNHEMDNIVKNDNIDNFCNPSTEKSNSNAVETLDRSSDPSLPTILCRTENFSMDNKVQPYVSKMKLLESLKNFLVSSDMWLKILKSNQDYADCSEKAVAFENYIKDSLNLKYPLNVWDVSEIISANLNPKSYSLLKKISNLRFFNLPSWSISPSIKRKSVFLGEKANTKCYNSSDLPFNQNQMYNTKLVKIHQNSSLKDIIPFDEQESSLITSSSLKRKCDIEEPQSDLSDTHDSMYIYPNLDEKQSGYFKRPKGDVDNATQIKQFFSLNKHGFMNLGLRCHPTFVQDKSCEKLLNENDCEAEDVLHEKQNYNSMPLELQSFESFVYEGPCNSNYNENEKNCSENYSEIKNKTVIQEKQKSSFSQDESYTSNSDKVITNPIPQISEKCNTMNKKFHNRIPFIQDESSWDSIFDESDTQIEIKATIDSTQEEQKFLFIQEESCESIFSENVSEIKNKTVVDPVNKAEQKCDNMQNKFRNRIPFISDESSCESTFDRSDSRIKINVTIDSTQVKGVQKSSFIQGKMCENIFNENDSKIKNKINTNPVEETELIWDSMYHKLQDSISFNQDKSSWDRVFNKNNSQVKNKVTNEPTQAKAAHTSSIIQDELCGNICSGGNFKGANKITINPIQEQMYANFKKTSNLFNKSSKIIQGDSFNSDGKHSETFNSFDLNSKCIQNGILKKEVQEHSNKKSAREISNLIDKDSREVSNTHNFSSKSFSDKNFEVNKRSEIIVKQEASDLVHTGVKRNLNSFNFSSDSKQNPEIVNFDNSRTKQTFHMPNRFPTCHIPPVAQGNKFPDNGINSLVLGKGHLHHISSSTNKICQAENQYKISPGPSNFSSVDSKPSDTLNAINLPPVTTCNSFVNIQNDTQKEITSNLPLDLSKAHMKLICNDEYSFDKKENTSSFNSSEKKSINQAKTITNECNIASLENPSKKVKSVGRKRSKNKNLSKTQDASSDRMPSPKPKKTRGKKNKRKKNESPIQSSVSHSSENVEDMKSMYEKLKNPYAYLFKSPQEETKPRVNAQKEMNSKMKNPDLLSSNNNNKIESHMKEMTTPSVSFEDLYSQRGSTAILPFENSITNVRRQEIEPFLVTKHANLLTNKEENSYCATFTRSKRKVVAQVESAQKKNKQRKTEITKKSPNHLQLASIKNENVKMRNEARIDSNVSLKPNLSNSFNTLHSYIVSSVDMIDKDISGQSSTAEENKPDFPMKQFKNSSSSPSSKIYERELNNKGSFKSHTNKFCDSKNTDNDQGNSVSPNILTNQPALPAANNTEAEKHASSVIRASSGFIFQNSNPTSSPRFSQFNCCDPITTEKLFSDFSSDGRSTSPSNYLKETVKPVLQNPVKPYPGIIKINKESSKCPLRFDVFKSNCKYNKEKVRCQKCDVAYHDDLFEENGLFPKYWKHINGFEYHAVDLSCVMKKRSDLSGDKLETFDFLSSQLSFHLSLLQNLIHKSSLQETDINYQDIIEQVDYIAGYELACKALLL